MARAHDQVTVDETIADATTVVRALVLDDHEPAASEASDRDRTGTIASRDDRPDRHEAELVQLRPTIVGVVAELFDQLVDHQCFDRAHRVSLGGWSDVQTRC